MSQDEVGRAQSAHLFGRGGSLGKEPVETGPDRHRGARTREIDERTQGRAVRFDSVEVGRGRGLAAADAVEDLDADAVAGHDGQLRRTRLSQRHECPDRLLHHEGCWSARHGTVGILDQDAIGAGVGTRDSRQVQHAVSGARQVDFVQLPLVREWRGAIDRHAEPRRTALNHLLAGRLKHDCRSLFVGGRCGDGLDQDLRRLIGDVESQIIAHRRPVDLTEPSVRRRVRYNRKRTAQLGQETFQPFEAQQALEIRRPADRQPVVNRAGIRTRKLDLDDARGILNEGACQR